MKGFFMNILINFLNNIAQNIFATKSSIMAAVIIGILLFASILKKATKLIIFLGIIFTLVLFYQIFFR